MGDAEAALLDKVMTGLQATAPFYVRDVWPADRAHIRAQLRPIPQEFRRHILADYTEAYLAQGRQRANLSLLEAREALGDLPFSLTADDDAIRAKAKAASAECGRLIARSGVSAGVGFCLSRGVEPPPTGSPELDRAATARMRDSHWWRQKLRKALSHLIETAAQRFNLVNGHRAIYVSDTNVERRRTQKSRNQSILEAVFAINELDQEYSLAELSELGMANPRLRRNELMTRMAGFEDYARGHGHAAWFYTITCPGKMHRSLKRSGQKNPKWDGTTPKQAQAYLVRTWAQIRAKAKRAGLSPFGFRIAEPHHDGTPHWHLLLFGPPEEMRQLTRILRDYTLRMDSHEPGAQQKRFEAVAIDYKKGTATGYVAKYVSKNIDGTHLDSYDEDPKGREPTTMAERVDAWASTWGIRQFQQVGGPPVSVWRELRRLGDGVAVGPLVTAWKAADSGDWAAFVESMGGHTCPRASQPIRIWRAWSDKPGRYGEPIGDQIQGVCASNVVFSTRNHAWRIEVRRVSVAELSSKNKGREIAAPWSSVNNCTRRNGVGGPRIESPRRGGGL